MAEYKDDELGLRLTVPDRLTVGQQLQYRSMIAFYEQRDMYARFWTGARLLIDEWECEAMPDKDVDLDKVHDPAVADVIFTACNIVSGHMRRLESEAVPKNS